MSKSGPNNIVPQAQAPIHPAESAESPPAAAVTAAATPQPQVVVAPMLPTPSATATAARVSANLDAARAAALARTNEHLRGLLDGLMDQSSTGREESPRAAELTDGDPLGRGAVDSSADGGLQARWRRDSRSLTGQPEEAFPRGEGESVPSVASVAVGGRSPSGVARALRSLVDSLQERDARIEGLEVEVRRSQEARMGAVQAREVALEKGAAEAAVLRAEVR